jgi:hypothetical protein
LRKNKPWINRVELSYGEAVHAAVSLASALLLTLPSPIRAQEVTIPNTRETCPFTRASGTMLQTKDQLSKFSFQLVQQGSQAKDGICQTYMNTLNAARTAYGNILRSAKLSASAGGTTSSSSSTTQAELDAQIQMSSALGGMLNSNCVVDDESAISATALNVMNSISNTLTIAGLVAPQALLVGVGLSAVSQLGSALANALISHDAPKDRLNNLLQSDAFLERLCIFRQLAYNVDAIDMDLVDAQGQKRLMETQLADVTRKLYNNDGIQCFITRETAQIGYEQLSSELKDILAASDKKAASQKCANYTYAIEDRSKASGRVRGAHLYDVAWRIGCRDIGYKDPESEEAATGSPQEQALQETSAEASTAPDASAATAPTEAPKTTTTAPEAPAPEPANPISFRSRRVRDFCSQWRNLMDRFETVDCFGLDATAVQAFNEIAEFIFTNAASASEAAIEEERQNSPDLYATYLNLKGQKIFLEGQLKILNDVNTDQANILVQAQGMLTNLGDILLGKGLKQYADWNKKEISRNLENTEEKLEDAGKDNKAVRCTAGQYATQRMRQILPRIDSLQKVCTVMGAHGKAPQPAFKDPTRTFDSIIDLQESPLDEVCTDNYLKLPKNYYELVKKTAEYMKDCD